MGEMTTLALVSSGLGLIIIGAMTWVWWKAFSKQWYDKFPVFTCSDTASEKLSGVIALYEPIYRAYIEKRNEFWFGFGQVVIVALSIIVITVLLLAGKIDQQAGLPILSGLSGFAIAKTVTNTPRRSKGD